MSNELNLSLYKTSSVGTTVNSNTDAVEIKYEYSGIGWFFMTFFGTTQIAKKVSFVCLVTNETFEVLTEKKLIEHFSLFRTK